MNGRIILTADDMFELKRLRDRAEQEARKVQLVNGYSPGWPVPISTDQSREAQHHVETLNRILKQV